MEKFELRRDRYNVFRAFENPLLNLGFTLDLPDFRPFCRANELPPFHVFLYVLLSTIRGLDNFMYRIHEGEVIKIDRFFGSFTVLNQDNNLNYARFIISDDLREFVARSTAAKREAEQSGPLINTAADLSALEQRQNIYITCLPWLQLNAIEHPVYRHQEYDIPSIAWGKFGAAGEGRIALPMSVQAHHGFVDGYHVQQLAALLTQRLEELISRPA